MYGVAVPFELEQLFAIFQIPDPSGVIMLARGHGALAVRRDGHTYHMRGVPLEREELFPVVHIPKPQPATVKADQGPFPIGSEGNTRKRRAQRFGPLLFFAGLAVPTP